MQTKAVRAAPRLLVALVALVAATVAASPRRAVQCTSELDCELNGACLPSGQCSCAAPWTGPTCGTLDVRPARRYSLWPPEAEQRHAAPNSSAYSWGFSHLKWAGKHHGFVNVGCYICTQGMVAGTLIAHVASDAVDGPYELQDLTLPTSAFNPHVLRRPEGGVALLFRRNAGSRDWAVCAGAGDDTLTPRTNSSEVDKERGMNVALADDPHGPWAVQPLRIIGWEHVHVSNPSVAVLRNGTVFMAYRYNLGAEHVGFARADAVEGPYTHVANLSVPGEDPYLWQSPERDEELHVLFHVEDRRAYSEWPSLHAFSRDGGASWHVSRSVDGRGAYSTRIEWEDGGGEAVFARRERPELVVDEATGRPLWLLTAVQEKERSHGCHWGYSYSVAQPLAQTAAAETQQVVAR